MLSLRTRPQKSSKGYVSSTAQSTTPDIWDSDLAVGRAKVYLVGNPFAEDVKVAGVPDPNLQVMFTQACMHFSVWDSVDAGSIMSPAATQVLLGNSG